MKISFHVAVSCNACLKAGEPCLVFGLFSIKFYVQMLVVDEQGR